MTDDELLERAKRGRLSRQEVDEVAEALRAGALGREPYTLIHILGQPRVLMYVRLSTRHEPTGATPHYRGGYELPPPEELRIVRYETDSGVYLFYLDETGQELTDAYHESMTDAF